MRFCFFYKANKSFSSVVSLLLAHISANRRNPIREKHAYRAQQSHILMIIVFVRPSSLEEVVAFLSSSVVTACLISAAYSSTPIVVR